MATKKNPFDEIYKELKKYEGTLSKTAQSNLQSMYNNIVKKIIKKKFRFLTRSATEKLTKAYRQYTKNGFKVRNKGIRGWRLTDLKPKLQKELKKRIYNSISSINLNTFSIINEMNRRFLGFISNEKRSNAKDELKPMFNINKKDKATKRTITDQTLKMIGSFDRTIADHYKAIAFIWNGREDRKEAGNPTGLYPNVDPNSTVHGDHWARNNKLYFYKDTWAIKEGLINTKSKNFKLADFKDGMPSEPINCRCWAYNLYDLQDIYERHKDLLTKKGLHTIEKTKNE